METIDNNPGNSEGINSWEGISTFEEERRLEIDRKLGHAALENNSDPFITDEILNKRELAEQAFNATLTKVNDLESAIEAGDERIKKDSVECDGKELPVYTLDNYPFHYLSHTVDYQVHPKGYGNSHIITTGTAIAAQLMVNPSFWTRPSHEVDTEVNEKSGAKTLSTSYIETEHNNQHFFESNFGLIYGFDSITPGTLLGSSPNDTVTGRQGETVGKRPLQSPTELVQNDLMNPGSYNEVAVNRYDENGEPVLPSFMIAHNNRISEFTKRHAAYFNIPIINILTPEVKADYASPDKLKPILGELNKAEKWMVDHYEPDVRIDVPEWLDQSS